MALAFVLITAAAPLLFTRHSAGQFPWFVETVGAGAGTTGVVVDAKGRVHAIYGRGLPITELIYGIEEGGSWILQVIDAGSYFEPSIALDTLGSPRIAYFRGADHMMRYAYKTGSDFTNETIEVVVSGYSHPSIAVDRSGRPHVAYVNDAGVGAVYLRYAVRNDTGWIIETIDTLNSVSTDERPSLALDSKGNPRVAFHTWGTNPLLYYRRDGVSWTSEIADFWGTLGSCCEFPSLALDSQDDPHIAVYNLTGSALRYIRFDPLLGRWLAENVYEQGGWVTYPGWPSLAIGRDDKPMIAYFDTLALVLRYFFFDGIHWVMETPDPVAQRGQWNSIALDPVGAPHILYNDVNGPTWFIYHAWQEWPDTVPPSSSVNPIRPYWHTGSLFDVTANATDPGQGVANVTLWYRYALNNASWNAWQHFATDNTLPWEWSFPFPDGEGFYEFYSIAVDNASNSEPPPTPADTIAAYDATPPVSSALPIYPYWWTTPSLVVNATASDGLSDVHDVTLLYSFSFDDNTTWSNWTPFSTDLSPPWSWSFPFPGGEGHYRFHAVATDNAGNVEGSKMIAEAVAGYRPPLTPGHRLMSFPWTISNDSIDNVLSSISGCYDYVRWYDPLDSFDHWKSYAPNRVYNDLTRLDNTMGFWIDITASCTFTPSGTRPVSTAIDLHQGWNMIGFPSFNTTYTVGDLKVDIGLAGIAMEAFDAAAAPYYLQRASDSYVMKAGEGYWVYVPSDATWTISG